MPGTDQPQRDRIEAAWFRQGFTDGADGRVENGPESDDITHAAGMGLDTAGAYHRGYAAGREQYLREQVVDRG